MQHFFRWSPALRITLAYIGFSLVWIAVSDWLLPRGTDWAVPISVTEGGTRRAVATLVLHTDPVAFFVPLFRIWPTSSTSAETLLVEEVGGEAVLLTPARHENWSPLAHRVPLTTPGALILLAEETGLIGALGK